MALVELRRTSTQLRVPSGFWPVLKSPARVWPNRATVKTCSNLSLDKLPVEIIRKICEHLSFVQVTRLRGVSKGFSALCSSPSFFRELDLSEVSSAFTALPLAIRKHARKVILHGSTASTAHISSFMSVGDAFVNLTSLDLSFCAANELLFDSLSSRARCQLKCLIMRGCRQLRDGIWLAELLPNLEILDLSWSGLRTLPAGEHKSVSMLPEAVMDEAVMDVDLSSDDTLVASDDTLVDAEASLLPWHSLKRLELAGCGHLSRDSLTAFLTEELPPSLTYLSLAWQTPLSLDIDSITRGLPSEVGDRAFELDVTRCDSVTLAHIAELQRRMPRATIRHTAILENESLAAYKRYIELLSASLIKE